MTEWNIFAVGSMQQVSYINGMHAALVLGEFVKNDYGMATRWDLTNGWNEEGNDHGMFSRGGEPGVDHYNPRPVFFYMKYFQDYVGDQLVESSLSGSEEVIAYASTFSSGEAGLVLINKGTTGETVQLDLENHNTGARYHTMTLTGGEDNGDFSRKVLLNGMEGDEEGGGPDNYESVRAFASSAREGIRVALPPLSVVYLMVERSGPLSYVSSKIESDPRQVLVELSEEVLPLENPSGFELLLNGTTPVGISAIERDPDHPWLLKLSLDQAIHKGDELLLSYSDGAVITSGGEDLPAFTDQKVSNLLAGDPFQITFLLTTADAGVPIGDCEVRFNGVMATTDESGKAVFSEPEGSYAFSASKQHFMPVEEVSFSIYSDTLIGVKLDSMAYRVEFVLTDLRTGNPLTGVEISAHEHTETTGRDGRAQILLYAGLHPVSFNARNYAPLSSAYLIESDTILKVGMEQSHARVKFTLLDGVQPVNKARVILGEDSLITGQLGIGTFASVALGQEVDYRAEKTDYTSLHGSLFVRGDTTLTLQMPRSVTSMFPEEDSDRLRIFPNPARNYLVVESKTPILRVEVMNLNGEVLYSRSGKSRKRLELAFHLPPGMYLIRVGASSGIYSSVMVVSQ
jgi:hypothetical protein